MFTKQLHLQLKLNYNLRPYIGEKKMRGEKMFEIEIKRNFIYFDFLFPK